MILALLIFAMVGPLLALLWKQFGSHRLYPPTVTPGWIEGLSVDRYRPMLNILHQEDFRALRTQPGYKPQMATRLRIQRCRMLELYLQSLDADFKRVSMALKIIMVRSQRDRSDLARTLVQSQAAFASGMIVLRFRLRLYRWVGLNVDPAGVLKAFEAIHVHACTLAPRTPFSNATAEI